MPLALSYKRRTRFALQRLLIGSRGVTCAGTRMPGKLRSWLLLLLLMRCLRGWLVRLLQDTQSALHFILVALQQGSEARHGCHLALMIAEVVLIRFSVTGIRVTLQSARGIEVEDLLHLNGTRETALACSFARQVGVDVCEGPEDGLRRGDVEDPSLKRFPLPADRHDTHPPPIACCGC